MKVGVDDGVAVVVGVLVGADVGESLDPAKGESAGDIVPMGDELPLHADSRKAEIEHSSKTPAAHRTVLRIFAHMQKVDINVIRMLISGRC